MADRPDAQGECESCQGIQVLYPAPGCTPTFCECAMSGVLQGHVLDVLAGLPAESVSCVVTSPPYWSLRKYDAPDVVWGGDEVGACEHEWGEISKSGAAVEGYAGKKKWQHSVNGRGEPHPEARHRTDNPDDWTRITVSTNTCARCGAWRGQYGLEPTPELYVEHTLAWLREVRRVLRKDGVVWLNIGDGYAGGHVAYSDKRWQHGAGPNVPSHTLGGGALKPKDLILMPERIALAAQADGWWVRSRIIWHKPNAMPESAKDRPTDDHEIIWMLTKSARYWYDQEATRESFSEATFARIEQETLNEQQGGFKQEMYEQGFPGQKNRDRRPAEIIKAMAVNGNNGRNLRTVWSFPTAQTPEAHFATFPIELPTRCILASCPREICSACGKARVRLVNIERPDDYDPSASAADPKFQTAMAHRATANSRPIEKIFSDALKSTRSTIGWSDCGCGAPFEPGIVLDPFAGIGTTGLAALRLGRRFLGIELSEKYAEMAREKLRFWWRDTRLVEPERDAAQAVLPLKESRCPPCPTPDADPCACDEAVNISSIGPCV